MNNKNFDKLFDHKYYDNYHGDKRYDELRHWMVDGWNMALEEVREEIDNERYPASDSHDVYTLIHKILEKLRTE